MNAHSYPVRNAASARQGARRMAEGAAMIVLAVILCAFPSIAANRADATPGARSFLEQLADREVERLRK